MISTNTHLSPLDPTKGDWRRGYYHGCFHSQDATGHSWVLYCHKLRGVPKPGDERYSVVRVSRRILPTMLEVEVAHELTHALEDIIGYGCDHKWTLRPEHLMSQIT